MSSAHPHDLESDRTAEHETYKAVQYAFNTAYQKWKLYTSYQKWQEDVSGNDADIASVEHSLALAKTARGLVLLEIELRKGWIHKYKNNNHFGIWTHIDGREQCVEKLEKRITLDELWLHQLNEQAKDKAARAAEKSSKEESCSTQARKSALDAREKLKEEANKFTEDEEQQEQAIELLNDQDSDALDSGDESNSVQDLYRGYPRSKTQPGWIILRPKVLGPVAEESGQSRGDSQDMTIQKYYRHWLNRVKQEDAGLKPRAKFEPEQVKQVRAYLALSPEQKKESFLYPL